MAKKNKFFFVPLLTEAGLNGSGKSTFIKLLLGFYLQDEGEITLNHLPYDQYQTEEFRKLFGVVFQDYMVHNISFAENILFKKKLNKNEEEEVWETLEFSGLADKVRNLPNTIYCPISREFDENGVYLGHLYKLGTDKTVICISHRLSSTIDFDRIAVFDQGCIVECGSHMDLMSKKGLYYRMYQKQGEYYNQLTPSSDFSEDGVMSSLKSDCG